MGRIRAALVALSGLAVAMVFGVLDVAEADRTGQPQRTSLDAAQTLAARVAVRDSDLLKGLAAGREYNIVSVGPWRTVGALSGAAVLIDFTEPIELRGAWPVMNVLNPVSEADKARGVPDPAKLDIRFESAELSAVGREFSLLVDLTGIIRNISVAPPRAPEMHPASANDGNAPAVPPTAPRRS